MNRKIQEDHTFESAREFLDAISPRGPWFGANPNPSPWIFRGHARDSWTLLPSALRPNERDKLHAIARTNPEVRARKDTNIAQFLAEVAILCDLEEELDRGGLPIQSTDPSLASILSGLKICWDKNKDGGGSFWPRPGCVQIMSLAQHYLLPTRLLDWTFSANIAAYFAADPDTIEKGEESGLASVWALNSSGMPRGITMRKAPNLNTIPVPRHSNPYFHAQNGIFTLQGLGGEAAPLWSQIQEYPLEVALKDFNDSDQFEPDHLFLRHFTFPRAIAGEVLWLLEKEGVTAATLFPGHIGAARAVREKRFSVTASQ